MKISSEIKSYKDNSKGKDRLLSYKKPFDYFPKPKERVRVVHWSRWPSYDFIFGYPDKSNPYFKQEVGFFQCRDTRHKKVKEGFYVDKNELNQLVIGFSKIKNASPPNTRPSSKR